MLTCQLQLKMKSKTECPLSMYRFFVTIKYLPILSTINLLLVTFIQILIAFYHLPISLVLYSHSLIDASECAQVGLNYTLNYFLWNKFSLKMAILKILFQKIYGQHTRSFRDYFNCKKEASWPSPSIPWFNIPKNQV